MPNIEAVTKDGARKPVLPDEIWARVEPLLVESIGLRKRFQVKRVADSLGLSPPSVSTWINGKGRPTLNNLIATLRLLGHDPVELIPEYLKTNDQPWRALALQHGDDPDDPIVEEVYTAAFQGAIGLTSEWAKGELARRRGGKDLPQLPEPTDDGPVASGSPTKK